jgi:Fur family zinc uptake transcriptional regulator
MPPPDPSAEGAQEAARFSRSGETPAFGTASRALEPGDPTRSGSRFAAKLTPGRRTVLEILSDGEHPMTAYDIAGRLSTLRGRAVAPVSVYRSLDFLIGAGLAARLESRNAFVLCAHPGIPHDCVFLLCKACGQAQEIIDHGLSRQLDRHAAKEGFTPCRRIVEVQGLCRTCTQARTGELNP